MIGFLLLAMALPSANAGEAAPSYESVTVPIIHRSDMESSAQLNSPVTSEKSTTRRLELAASSWSPNNFQSPSNVAATAFQSSVVPGLSVTYLAPLQNYRWAEVDWKAGIGYLGMTRQSPLPIGAQIENQSLYLFSGNIGADLKPTQMKFKECSPYLGASLMPTIVVTNQAIQSDGTTTFGVPFQASLGATIGSHWTGYAALRDIEFNLAVVKTLNGIGESGLSGTGLMAGVRFVNF